jgi:cystathionine beta-synthase
VPGVQIVAVDPFGSILAVPDSMNDGSARTGQKRLTAYHVEGIGYDFIPTVLDSDTADHWVKSDDDESFAMGRCIIRHEGLLIGGSCGATMAGAYRFIRDHKIGADKRVVVLLADGARNYMSKFIDDDWMTANGFNVDDVNKAVNVKGEYAKIFKC